MPRGGFHGRGGPAPNPDALRRDRPSDAATWTTLPAERVGPTPEWPLPRPTTRELEIWHQEWRRPQAVEWERLGLDSEVALFVRASAEAELPGAAAAVRNFVRIERDNLGLTVSGLARHRWRIGPAPTTRPGGAFVVPITGGRAARPSARDRFRTVTPTDPTDPDHDSQEDQPS